MAWQNSRIFLALSPQGQVSQMQNLTRQAGGHWFEPSTAHSTKPRYRGVFSFNVPASGEFRIGYGNEMATAGLAAWVLRVVLRPRRKK